jgi:hypothetical protein
MTSPWRGLRLALEKKLTYNSQVLEPGRRSRRRHRENRNRIPSVPLPLRAHIKKTEN